MKDRISYVKIFKACSDEKRLKVLTYIKDEEKCACELIELLGIAQSALSYHMNILCETGIVNQRKDGKWMYYSINKKGIVLARNMFDKFL